MDLDFGKAVDGAQYALWLVVSQLFWACDQLLLLAGVQLHSWRRLLLSPDGLVDLILNYFFHDAGATLLKGYIGAAVTAALLLAAVVYALRFLANAGRGPVDLARVFAWFVLAALLFHE